MLCEQCGQSEAVRHYRSNVNGVTREAHLCAACAAELGMDAQFHEMMFSVPSMMSEMFGLTAAPTVETRGCPGCGCHLADISRSGQAGCAECYSFFGNVLSPYLQKIYGRTQHTGRMPRQLSAQRQKHQRLGELKARLLACVEAQEYEKAVELRDEIKKLEGEENDAQ